MKQTIYFYYFFFFLFVSNDAVAQRLIYDQNIPVEKIRVVLEQTRGGTVSEMLSDLEYIPFQSGKSDLLDDILDMQVLGDRVAVISQTKGYFYLYNIDGTLLKKITNINAFAKQDKENSQLFHGIYKEGDHFMISHSKFRVKVNRNGDIIDTVSYENEPTEKDPFGQVVGSTIQIGNTNYKYISSLYDKDRKRQDILLKNDSAIIQYHELDTIESYFNISLPFSKVVNDKAYLTIPFHYKFFVLGEDGIRGIYELVFPLRNTIPSYQSSPEIYRNTNNSINYLVRNPQTVYGIGRMFAYKDYLIFFVGRFQNPMWLAYDLKTKELMSLTNIVAGKSNDFLDYYDMNKIFLEGDYLYSFIYPSQVRAAINKCADERHTMRKAYRDLEKANNPILVRFKLK